MAAAPADVAHGEAASTWAAVSATPASEVPAPAVSATGKAAQRDLAAGTCVGAPTPFAAARIAASRGDAAYSIGDSLTAPPTCHDTGLTSPTTAAQRAALEAMRDWVADRIRTDPPRLPGLDSDVPPSSARADTSAAMAVTSGSASTESVGARAEKAAVSADEPSLPADASAAGAGAAGTGDADSDVSRDVRVPAVGQTPVDSVVATAEIAWLSESCLCRYLRARDWDVDAARTMLWETVQWRRAYGMYTYDVEGLRGELDLARPKMYVSDARDAAGRAVVINRKSKAPVRSHELGIRLVAYMMDKAARTAEAAGMEKWVWILDLAEYTRANSPPLSVSIGTLRMMQSHFPERLHRCFMVDAPWVFSLLWKALRGFADPVTREKIAFISNDAAGQAEMLRYVPAAALETAFGGTNAFVYNFDSEELRAAGGSSGSTSAGAGAGVAGSALDARDDATATATDAVADGGTGWGCAPATSSSSSSADAH